MNFLQAFQERGREEKGGEEHPVSKASLALTVPTVGTKNFKNNNKRNKKKWATKPWKDMEEP